MKTVLIVAACLAVVAVGTEAQVHLPNLNLPTLPPMANPFKSAVLTFNDAMSMTQDNLLKHINDNCGQYAHVNSLPDDVKLSNVMENMKTIMGKANGDFETGLTCMSAMSRSDFQATNQARPTAEALKRPATPTRTRRATTATPPASVDWRTKNAVSPVQDQGQCGSCWTFSANGAMEGAISIKTGNAPPNLSEQNLVDCVTASSGCNGGWMTDAYNYTTINKGINNETTYPYLAKQGTCKNVKSASAGTVTSWAYTNQDDEADLKSKLATVGPIAVAIDATNIQNYVSGVYNCSTFQAVNHGVLVVGYGTDAATAKDYYLVKNSWGSGWGESGYIRILRNKGSSLACGIPTYANYPIA